MNENKPILIVQGAQYGSEAKGMVAAALCQRRKVDYAVRTGAVNAGHTVYHKGEKYVNQQLPTGWVAGDGCSLVLGPGALIHPGIFERELAMVRNAGYQGKVFVDYRAGIHLDIHIAAGQASGQHYRIGATGKGCSHALISRIRRNQDSMTFSEWCKEAGINQDLSTSAGFIWTDTAGLLNDAYDRGEQVLLEGTQGTLLDLYLGPYPYTTHKQCTASQWVTEAGLSPSLEYEVVLVARTYPIRVAGNSGPMNNEITWPELAWDINAKLAAAGKPPLVDYAAVNAFVTAKNSFPESRYADRNYWLSESNRDALNSLPIAIREELAKLFEFTTVTKKLRRIARLDLGDLKYAVTINRPKWICLTFVNYKFPQYWGEAHHRELELDLNLGSHVAFYLSGIAKQIGAPIRAITTGPEACHFHDFSR